MKKLSILALAALLVVAFTIPAAALENEFGGYWRTRFYQQGHFDGEDGDAGSWRRVDTRTRLYYTAKINDNLKFVNKFEFDTTWGSDAGARNGRSAASTADYTFVDGAGQTNTIPGQTFLTSGNNRSYGDLEADGANIEIKNSYADFNLGPVNFTVGVQPYMLFRTAYIDADASGMIARWRALDNLVLAASWLKAFDGGAGSGNNEDIDSYTVGAGIWFSENIVLKPAVSYGRSSEANEALGIGELSRFTYGFDFDADFDNFSLWATAYMQSGDLENAAFGGRDLDYKGYLAIVGGNVMLGPVDLHGQVIYGSGDDDPLDDELDVVDAPVAYYYWAEILGLGIFDNTVPAGVPNGGGNVGGLTAGGLGVTFKPMDKLSITADVWYAELTEDNAFNENELGTELDVKVTYQLVEGLNLDLVGAYLWAGDALDGNGDGNNDEDPYEFGARLSLSF